VNGGRSVSDKLFTSRFPIDWIYAFISGSVIRADDVRICCIICLPISASCCGDRYLLCGLPISGTSPA